MNRDTRVSHLTYRVTYKVTPEVVEKTTKRLFLLIIRIQLEN